jgi:hypothetical protein
MASEQPPGSESARAPDKPPELDAAPPPVAAPRSGAASGSAGTALPTKKKKKKWKTQKKILVAAVPVIAAAVAAIGGIIGAEIQKSSSPVLAEPSITASSTPGTLPTGEYTISSSVLGYLGVPNPNATGLVEDCEPARVCWVEPDVEVIDQGGAYHDNQDWDISTSNSGTSYVIQSAYDGSMAQEADDGSVVQGGLSFPPSCDRLVSATYKSSYGFLVITPKCSMLPQNDNTMSFHNITDTFNILPIALGFRSFTLSRSALG